MSRVISSLGRARNSSQVQPRGSSSSPAIEKSHSSSAVCGVGPAERTGKSWVTYWPGGTRAGSTSAARRPRNPRETMGAILFSFLIAVIRPGRFRRSRRRAAGRGRRGRAVRPGWLRGGRPGSGKGREAGRSSRGRRRIVGVRLERRDRDTQPVGEGQGGEQTVERGLAVGAVQPDRGRSVADERPSPEPDEVPVLGELGRGG